MRTAVGEIEVGVDIGIAYLAISVTLGYLGYKGWCDILFSLDVPGVWIFYPQPQVFRVFPQG